MPFVMDSPTLRWLNQPVQGNNRKLFPLDNQGISHHLNFKLPFSLVQQTPT
jgi:hypothetical protein